MFMALNATDGKPLWEVRQSQIWRASPRGGTLQHAILNAASDHSQSPPAKAAPAAEASGRAARRAGQDDGALSSRGGGAVATSAAAAKFGSAGNRPFFRWRVEWTAPLRPPEPARIPPPPESQPAPMLNRATLAPPAENITAEPGLSASATFPPRLRPNLPCRA